MKNADNIKGILFDLDGTLLDSAPDLINALNTTLQQSGWQPLDTHRARPLISRGARRMITEATGDTASPNVIDHLLEAMLDYYANHIAVATRFFEGMEQVIESIEEKQLKWGIVTNKRTHYTQLLLEALNISDRPDCVICGDTLAYAKPHPAPLEEASRQLSLTTDECLFIGDSPLDIEAGVKAGMPTLAATYGYLAEDDDPKNWGACGLIDQPSELYAWLPIFATK